MIISASRRTDIPAFYSPWFMDKVKRSYCEVANPFNPHQVQKIDLSPEKISLFVFWTKNPEPLLPQLEQLDNRGFRYFFLYTLNPYSSDLEPGLPRLEKRIKTLQQLAGLIGPDKVICRYDPIIITSRMNSNYHREKFAQLAGQLKGYTRQIIISFFSPYSRAQKRLQQAGINPLNQQEIEPWRKEFLAELARIGADNDMEVAGCAQDDLERTGVKAGKCIDEKYIARIWGLKVAGTRDKGQRPACGCINSTDIGYYNSCQHQCLYCYARGSRERVDREVSRHRICSPSLL